MFLHAQLVVKSGRMFVEKSFKPSLACEDGCVHGLLVSVALLDMITDAAPRTVAIADIFCFQRFAFC